MCRIFLNGILALLIFSCGQEKTKLAPAGADFAIESEQSDTTSLPEASPPFQHAYLAQADSLRDLRDYEGAIVLYRDAAQKFEAEENWEGKVKAVNEWGHALYWIDEYDSAISLLGSNLEVARAKIDPIHNLTADAHFYLGKCHYQNHETEPSLRHHEDALRIKIGLFGKESLELVDSYIGLGNLHLRRINDLNQAEIYFKNGAAILENKSGSPAKRISIFKNLASIYRQNTDFQKSLEYNQFILNISDSLTGKNSRQYLTTLNDLGNVYSELGAYSDAKPLFEQAIRSLTNYYGEDDTDLGNCYNNLGAIYQWESKSADSSKAGLQNEQARLFSDSAYHLFHKGKAIAAPFAQSKLLSDCYFNLGWHHAEAKNFDSARYYYDQCITMGLKAKEFIYRQYGDLYLAFDSVKSALTCYQQALNTLVEDFPDSNIYINPQISSELFDRATYEIVLRKAPAFKKLYDQTKNVSDLEAALNTYLLVDKINNSLRNSSHQESSILYFIDYHQGKFEEAMEVAYQLFQLTENAKYLEDAFHIMEKNKYMLLFKSLGDAEKSSQVGIPKSIIEEESNLKTTLASLRSRLTLKESSTEVSSNEIKLLQTEIFELSRKRDLLKEKIAQDFQNYFEVKYDSVILSLFDVQGLIDDETQLVSFYWGEKNIYQLGVTKNKLAISIVPNTDSLNQTIERYKSLTLTPPKMISEAEEKDRFHQYQQVAQELYQNLLAPLILASPSLPSRLVIVPDGPLTQIPFESLVTSKTSFDSVDYRTLTYLRKEFLVSYAYSANLLFRYQSLQKPESAKNSVLAFGYSSNTAPFGMNGLPGSQREITTLEQTMNGEFYIGSEATKSAFKNKASEFDIIHLAIHGTADLENELSSKLIFQTETDSSQSNELYAYELYNLDLNKTRLAVLSACETGLGKQYKGEGTFSIARGFAYAGVPAIVMSLWKVDDAASSELMLEFYSKLELGTAIDQALDQAKNTYLGKADRYRAHPAYWASFISLGDVRPAMAPVNRLGWKVLWIPLGFLGLLAALAAIYWQRNREA